ncbi:MAG: hypothetical protein H7A37_03850 [Chlamydiales bacterium]|nr:hypothetical protein [Chlamydiales bacterium]
MNISQWTARDAAYHALLAFYRKGTFLNDTLNDWRAAAKPASRDERLAYELAAGCCRMSLRLDCHITQLPTEKPPQLKRKERTILHLALYQHLFMERIPSHALVNEAVALAKRHCHTTFVKFLNAILRKLPDTTFSPPSSTHQRLSYPEEFVNMLTADYGASQAVACLEAMNCPPIIQARRRADNAVITVEDLDSIAQSRDYYIQNSTPIALISGLAEKTKTPSTLLDLCASPGGKLLLAHDLYPQAQLFANDVSQQKLHRLQENLQKYNVAATLFCSRGEDLQTEQKYDLIILDVPCSNSGVLNKRPEARWRQQNSHVEEICLLQKQLLENAATLLNPEGTIWYLTCSILKKENEEQMLWAEKNLGAKTILQKTILPDTEGADGGYSCLLGSTALF